MSDFLSTNERSERMRLIRSSGTKMEVEFGKALWAAGLRYRKNDREVFGKPDFVFRRSKVAVFCDSEFWHGKDWRKAKNRFNGNREYWIEKITRNIRRDKNVTRELTRQGWIVIRFWSKELQLDLDDCVSKVKSRIDEARNVSSLRRKASSVI